VKGPGIIWVPLDGGQETKVLDRLRDDLSFAVTEQGVYHLTITHALLNGSSVLHFYDFATGTDRPAGGMDPILSRFDVVSGGRSIFFANVEKQNADSLLVENFR
jgi:hypothetical protein